MELKIQDLLKQAVISPNMKLVKLHDENESRRLTQFTKACKKIIQQLPFQQFLNILQKQQDIMRYLLMAQPLFSSSIDLIIEAMTDKYKLNTAFISGFFKAAQQVACLDDRIFDNERIMIVIMQVDTSISGSPTTQHKYCREVYKNFYNMKVALLIQIKNFAAILQIHHINNTEVIEEILHFYKIFIQSNHLYELLNGCFSDAMELRDVWTEMRQWDPYFEKEVEEILVLKNFAEEKINHKVETDSKSGKSIWMSALQKSKNYKDDAGPKLTKQEKLIKNIEDWLFQKNDLPIVSMSDEGLTLHSDFFKNVLYMEILLSFLLNPVKYQQVTDFRIHSIQGDLVMNQDHVPLFKSKWTKYEEVFYIEVEQRKVIQYRAFRTMLALTNTRNHFLITSANPDYFTKAFSMIYENLRISSSAFILCSNSLIQYIQFLLYYETDITIYFILYYNLPYRFLLHAEYASVSQFLVQLFLFQNGSKIYFIENQHSQMIWKYLELTEFFQDLMKISLGDDGGQLANTLHNQKAMVSFKPKNLSDELKKPDLTPHQQEKHTIPTNKIISFKQDQNLPDYDLMKQSIKQRPTRVTQIFKNMIETSPTFKKRNNIKSGTVTIQLSNVGSSIRNKSPSQNQIIDVQTQNDYSQLLNIQPSSQPNIFSILGGIIKDQIKEIPAQIPMRRPSIEINQKVIRSLSRQATPIQVNTPVKSPHPTKSRNSQNNIFQPEKLFNINHSKRLESLHFIDNDQRMSILKKIGTTDINQFSMVRRPSIGAMSLTATNQKSVSRHLFSSKISTQQTNLKSESHIGLPKSSIITHQEPKQSFLRRFENILTNTRPYTSVSGFRFKQVTITEELSTLRQDYLYPTSLRDYHATKLEEQGLKPEFEAEILGKNEEFSRELMGIIKQILEDVLEKRGKSRWELEQRRMKWLILTNQNIPKFLDCLAQNYFLKLKIQDEDNTPTCIVSGILYNKILQNRKNVVMNLQISEIEGPLCQQFQLLCLLITSTYVLEAWDDKLLHIQNTEVFSHQSYYQIFNHISIRTITLIESFTLIIETTQQPTKLISSISTSLWHLLLIYLVEYRTNEIYIRLVDRIMQTTIMSGNNFVFHKIVLRLNCFNLFTQILDEMKNCEEDNLWADLLPIVIKRIFLLIYCVLKLRSVELATLKSQIEILANYDKLKLIYKNDLQSVESTDYECLQKQLTEDNQKTFSKLLLNHYQRIKKS